ncbi:cysteine desulfurase [Candidatus Roizmanbacteria bacterium]|jgi:cysteine desulfurase|nr:cysteine desulfurase [Candidatus Roizmanbacteria bacterium]
MKKNIYLDYAATTPVDPRVLKSMFPYFSLRFGNTASGHNLGREAAIILDRSRQEIADFINAEKKEIYFTGSATESNNLVLKGIAFANRTKKNHLIVSEIEHDCILESSRWLQKQGFKITFLPVDRYGLVSLEDLEKAMTPQTALVSIIHGNNEIGTVQDIASIGRLCRERKIYFHTDASQSFGKISIDVRRDFIDLLTASSHKIYGPKGAALLFVRSGTAIEPILHGGGHENRLRSSTVNLPAVVGFAKAVEILKKEGKEEDKRLTRLRDYLINAILKNIKGTHLNGHPKKRLNNNINISFASVEGESLMIELDLHNILVSTGSACSSNTLMPSHVLMAIGLKPEEAHGSLRISLGRFTKKSDLDYFIKILPKIVDRLRQISPFKI